jgi:hypothetical protein
MDRRRVSLIGLMGAIAVLAVSFAAWRIPWLPLRTSAFFALVVFILLTATLGALLNRGASWVGFALFGWGWLAISFLSLAIGSWNSTADRMPIPMPIVSMCLIELHSFVVDNDQIEGEATAVILNSKGGHTLVSYSLVQICNIWFSLLAACVGGVLARLLDPSRPRPNSDALSRSIPSPGTRT